jgi:hypothetical protein
MPVCPECGSSRFSQYADKRYMVCDIGHVFVLIKISGISSDKEKAYADKLIGLLTKMSEMFLHFREVI